MAEPHSSHDDPVLAPLLTKGFGLHVAIADLVRSVHSDARPHPDDVLERFAALAPAHIPHVTHAGVMLVGHRHGVKSSAATGGYPFLINHLQQELEEGPAHDCAQDQQTVRVDDLETDQRWPRFTQAAVRQTPVRSILCFPLLTPVQPLGALTLCSNQRFGFDAAGEESGAILATHAALTLQAVQRNRQFRSALGSRDIIGQAKGILMERYNISVGAAFALLTRVSQESGKPVVVVAKELVEAKPNSDR